MNIEDLSIEELEELIKQKQKKNIKNNIEEIKIKFEEYKTQKVLIDNIKNDINILIEEHEFGEDDIIFFNELYWSDGIFGLSGKALKKVKNSLSEKETKYICKGCNEERIYFKKNKSSHEPYRCNVCIKIKEMDQQEKNNELQRLKTMPYSEYLLTDHWKKKSYNCKQKVGFKCQKCNSKENLVAHHLTYEHCGEEWGKDLICICDECHKKEHNK